MTYAEASRIYAISIEAGQDRQSTINDLRAMGLTDPQVWAVVNSNPRHF